MFNNIVVINQLHVAGLETTVNNFVSSLHTITLYFSVEFVFVLASAGSTYYQLSTPHVKLSTPTLHFYEINIILSTIRFKKTIESDNHCGSFAV